MSEKFVKIVKYAKFISKRPNTKTNYFYLDEVGQMMMISIKKLESLPDSLEILNAKEHAVLLIDLSNSRELRFFAYNVDDPVRETFKDEIEGTVGWALLEDCILQFFSSHIKNLINYSPNENLNDIINRYSSEPTTSSSRSTQHQFYETNRHNGFGNTEYHRRGNWQDNSQPNYSSTNWNAIYKEREEFQDTTYKLIKEGKTGKAIEYVQSKCSSLIKEEKFEALNSIFQFIESSKLNIFTRFQMLKSTKDNVEKFPERKHFALKLQNQLNQLNSPAAKKMAIELQEIMGPVSSIYNSDLKPKEFNIN